MNNKSKEAIEQLSKRIEFAIYEFQLNRNLDIDTIDFGEYFPNCNGYGLRINAIEKIDGKKQKIAIHTVIQKNF